MILTEVKARLGVWTPWSLVLCVECDYAGLRDGSRGQHYVSRLKTLAAMNRTEDVARPEGDLIASCDNCHCPCWVRKDVALLQQVGFKSSDLDWEGPFGWSLEQTGGMCAALVFTTDDREVVVTAMDGEFFIGEYRRIEDDSNEEPWIDAIRTWKSESLYQGDELKDAIALEAMVEECARKVLAFVHSTAQGTETIAEIKKEGRS